MKPVYAAFPIADCAPAPAAPAGMRGMPVGRPSLPGHRSLNR